MPILVSLFDKQRFEYSYLTGGTGVQSVTLARALNVVPYYEATLLLRVHKVTLSAGQSMVFTLYNTLPSEEDPQEFTDVTTIFTSLTMNSGTAAPSLLSARATSPQAYLKLVLTATQGSVTGTALYGEVSGCLLLRERT